MKPALGFACTAWVLAATLSTAWAADSIEATRALKRLSIQEISKLADDGDAKAEAELAARYGLGTGVPKEYGRAIDLLRHAASKNEPDAQYYLGTAFTNGTGVPRDNMQATLWYELAARQQIGRAHV